MGTRADFYIKGLNNKLTWQGSIGWDGFPDSIDLSLLKSNTIYEFKTRIIKTLCIRKDFTLPKDGWPWPWNDSNTTDYAYIFDVKQSKVLCSQFGSNLFDPIKYRLLKNKDKLLESSKQKIKFPNMEKIKNISYGKNSGLIIIG